MTWTNQHDILLCREILVAEPFQFKHGSRKKGRCRDKVADCLNTLESPKFSVDQRAVRDHFVKLERVFLRKMNAEMRASGIQVDHSKLDQALEEIIERKECEEQLKEKASEGILRQKEKEKECAEAVRKRAMESFSQTKVREGGEKKRRKRNGAETSEYVGYLKEKREVQMSVTERQLSLERKKVEVEEKRLERQLELKERELVLKERELMLKEKNIDRFSGYIKQQALFQDQIFTPQQHISNIEMQNAEILRLIKSLHQK